MNAELICVGSELLSGKTLNTNAQFISRKLSELGHSCNRQFTVDDNKERIGQLVKDSVLSSDIIIVTGGLGPTDDDVTKEAVCEALDLPLVENKKCKEHLESFFSRLGKTPTQNNFKQITAPVGAIIFKNERGTACGIGIEINGKTVILLPGPPKELTFMFETYVIPYLKRLERNAVVTHTLNVFGMGESAIETAIKAFVGSNNPVVATYCKDNECEISITAFADTTEKADKICSETIFRIKSVLGDVIYGTDSSSLAHEVVNMLRKCNLKVATAESCTGGMLSSSLTSVPNASDAVEIGILAYSNRIKNEALSVPQDVLLEEGAISAETAMYLAKNVRILSGADIGVSITGNAGPSASENKPVGLVYVAIADRTKYFIKKLTLPSNYGREKIRSYATLTALDLIRRYVLARPNTLKGMLSLDEDFFFDEVTESNEVASTQNSFNVFEIDENFDFDINEETVSQNNSDVIIDINSFITASEKKGPVILSQVKDFVLRHWIKLVSVFVLLALFISSTVLISNFAHESHQISLIENAREEFKYNDADKNEDSGVFESFKTLVKKNSDIKAWIKIDGTKINNPIYQTDDNKYYQSHNMAKEKSRYGALFFDKNNIIEKENNSQNLTVYGHNTTNGIMFGELDSYHSLSYYKGHPVIKLKTLYEQSQYLIFAVMITNADKSDDNGNIFNYASTGFKDLETLNSFINEVKKRSIISVPVNVWLDDEILTLSTHSDEFENARFVVMAKKITGENEIQLANKATLNKNVKYPQAWYDKNDLSGYEEIVSKPVSSSEESSNENSSDNSSSDESSSNIDNSSEEETSGSTPSDSKPSSSTPSSSNPSSSENSETVNPANCNHVYADKYEHKDATTHSYKCTLCGTLISVAHEFTLEKAEAAFADTNAPATCTTAATYFKSCKCGIKGTETFKSGNPLPHDMSPKYHFDDFKHWRECQNANCNEKSAVEEHVYSDTGFCICEKAKPVTQEDVSEVPNTQEQPTAPQEN